MRPSEISILMEFLEAGVNYQLFLEALQGITVPQALEILKLQPGASPDQVKSAYRQAVQVAHPDHGGSHDAFTRVSAAYQILLAKGTTPAPSQDQTALKLNSLNSLLKSGKITYEQWCNHYTKITGKAPPPQGQQQGQGQQQRQAAPQRQNVPNDLQQKMASAKKFFDQGLLNQQQYNELMAQYQRQAGQAA